VEGDLITMRNIEPLSERFDLRYVREHHWHDVWPRRIGLIAMALAAGWVGASWLRADFSMYSAGPLTTAHAVFADDCSQCHQPDPERSGFWLPVQDSACLRCHVAPAHHPHQSMFVGEPGPFTASGARGSGGVGAHAVRMSSNCAACHVEHKGPNHDLRMISDNHCIQCHKDLNAFGRAPAMDAAYNGSLP